MIIRNSYAQWCAELERRYDTIPSWYWIEAENWERYHEWKREREEEEESNTKGAAT